MPETIIYAASWLVSPPAPPVAGGAIAVRRGTITDAGPLDTVRRAHPGAPLVEYPDCAIVPGFVNAHTHLELTHFPSWRLRTHVDYNPHRFVDWIIQLIKVNRGLQPADYQASVREGVRMCLESGTTAVGDIINRSELAAIHRGSPLAGRLYFEVLGQDPARFRAMLDQAVAACGTDPAGNLGTGLSPHTPYTINEGNLPLVREAASARNLPLAVHISESAAESDFIFDTSGPLAEEFYPFLGWESHLPKPRRCTSTQLLDQAGLLTPATLAVHCVHVNLADAEILKQRGVSVVLCPRSNDRLDVGRAPVALLKKLGIPLALGTDSLASNESLSMWDEMRFALNAFFRELSPEEVLLMATGNGAAAIGQATVLGALETGKRADFQIVANVGRTPRNLLEQLIFAGQVQEVFAGGERYPGALS